MFGIPKWHFAHSGEDGVCIRIPGRAEMILFNMQQSKGSRLVYVYSHLSQSGDLSRNTQIILMSKAYY